MKNSKSGHSSSFTCSYSYMQLLMIVFVYILTAYSLIQPRDEESLM